MVYYTFLIITCFLQVFAAVVAIRLTRLTKLNFSWILICAGLATMSARSIINIIQIFVPDFGFDSNEPYSWGGFFVSFCFAIGVYMIQKIFIQIRIADVKQRAYEKRLLKTMIQTEEDQRKRFATELHDGLGPLLSSIKMGFSAIANDIQNKEIRQNLEQAISEAIMTVREVSNNLSPHILNNFGLENAIRNFLGKIAIPKGFVVDYKMSIGDKRYTNTKEIVLYRVFCELFNNTLRHAQATEIHFTLSEHDGIIALNYTDNGIGFNPTQRDDTTLGLGYYNIVSRVSSLKGQAKFSTLENGSGLNVVIEIPADDK